jgi:hypothetical protein
MNMTGKLRLNKKMTRSLWRNEFNFEAFDCRLELLPWLDQRYTVSIHHAFSSHTNDTAAPTPPAQ